MSREPRRGPGPAAAAGAAAGAARGAAVAAKGLGPEQRLAGGAALGLVVSMFLPWYEKNATAIVNGRLQSVSDGLSAFGVFSFIEAAVLLVALAVLVLLHARGRGRPFHLPGGDGTVVLAAGGWVGFLLVVRLFDKPSAAAENGSAVTIGVNWGIFFALALAGLLAVAGARLRAAHLPEPVAPAAVARDASEDATWVVPGADDQPTAATAVVEPGPARGRRRRPRP